MEAISVKAEIKKFGETVSVRGISKLIKSENRIGKLFWLTAILISSSILLWQLSSVLALYRRYPIATTFSEGTSNDLSSFPDITACNIYPLAESIFNTANSLSWSDYLNYVESRNVSNSLDQVNKLYPDVKLTRDVFENLLVFMRMPSWYYVNLSPTIEGNYSTNFVVNYFYFDWNWYPMFDSGSKMKTIWNFNYYKCQTFHPSEAALNNILGLSVILYINDFPEIMTDTVVSDPTTSTATGVRVIVHNPGTKADLKNGISIGPGLENTVTIMPTVRKRLDKPHNANGCSKQDHINGSEDVYTYRACFDTCLQNYALDKCRCIMPYYQASEHQLVEANFRICFNQSVEEDRMNITRLFKDTLCLQKWLTQVEWNVCE